MTENYNPYDAEHQRIRDKYHKNVEDLFDDEKRLRKEKHGNAKIIFYQEISPVQMFQNVIDNTSFIFKNRAKEEGKKVIYKTGNLGKKKKNRNPYTKSGHFDNCLNCNIYTLLQINKLEWKSKIAIIVCDAFIRSVYISYSGRNYQIFRKKILF